MGATEKVGGPASVLAQRRRALLFFTPVKGRFAHVHSFLALHSLPCE